MVKAVDVKTGMVHCHQAFSTLGGEALVQARTMGYKVSMVKHGQTWLNMVKQQLI
jgi:hypothetical protein